MESLEPKWLGNQARNGLRCTHIDWYALIHTKLSEFNLICMHHAVISVNIPSHSSPTEPLKPKWLGNQARNGLRRTHIDWYALIHTKLSEFNLICMHHAVISVNTPSHSSSTEPSKPKWPGNQARNGLRCTHIDWWALIHNKLSEFNLICMHHAVISPHISAQQSHQSPNG